MTTSDPAPVPDHTGRRLHVVTGKGGTGKTTVAAALALSLAGRGRRVLLAEVEGRQGISQAFEVPPLADTEELVLRVPGGEIWGISVDAKTALIEYLRLFYHLGAAGGVLQRLGAIDFATTIAPGVRDVLLIGKVYEAVGRTDAAGRPTYDAVVLDAPPTGRVVRFLNVNHEVAELAKVGPIRTQADSITRLLRSGQSLVHVVTLLEEMPVQETIEAVRALRAAHLPVGSVVVNQAREQLLSDAAVGAVAAGGRTAASPTAQAHDTGLAAVAAGLLASGLPADDGTVAGLLHQARAHVARLAAEDDQFAALDGLGASVLVLPHLLDPTGASSVRALAQDLAGQAGW